MRQEQGGARQQACGRDGRDGCTRALTWRPSAGIRASYPRQTPGVNVRAIVEVRVGAEGGLPKGGGEGGREGEAGGGTHLERVGARVLDAAGLDEEFLHFHVIEDGRVAPPGGRSKRGLGTLRTPGSSPRVGVPAEWLGLSPWACRAAQSQQGLECRSSAALRGGRASDHAAPRTLSEAALLLPRARHAHSARELARAVWDAAARGGGHTRQQGHHGGCRGPHVEVGRVGWLVGVCVCVCGWVGGWACRCCTHSCTSFQ